MQQQQQEQSQKQDSFDEVLAESVRASLRGFLGDSAFEVLMQNYHLDDLTGTPGQLHNELTQIFGKGALVLERVMVRELFSNCGVRFEDSDRFNFNLERCVERARGQYNDRAQVGSLG